MRICINFGRNGHLQPKNHPNKSEAALFAAWEGYFHSIVYVALKSIGLNVQCEVAKHKGRLDAILELDQYIYIMEFKLDKSANSAIQQIKEQGYIESYLEKGKEVILLGISFDSTIKNVSDWTTETLNN